MTEIERIAAGLSEAQVEWLTLEENAERFWCDDRRVWRAIHRKGLVEGPVGFGSVNWKPLGLAVRAHLEKNDAE